MLDYLDNLDIDKSFLVHGRATTELIVKIILSMWQLIPDRSIEEFREVDVHYHKSRVRSYNDRYIKKDTYAWVLAD